MRRFLLAVLFVSGWVVSAPGQCDDCSTYCAITNTAQFAEQFSRSDLLWLPWSPIQWQAFPLDGQPWWWTDFSQLPTQFGACQSASTLESSGIKLLGITLTLDVLSGQVVVQAQTNGEELARSDAPSDYSPTNWSRQATAIMREWQQCEEDAASWGEDYLAGGPQVLLRARLASIDDKPAYDAQVAAEEAAYESNLAAQASSPLTFATDGRFGAMDDSGGGMMMDNSSDPCTITNDSAPFSVVSLAANGNGNMALSWQSCTDHIYVVQSETSLAPTSSWTDVAWMFGTDQQTIWTDTNAVGQVQRYYRVARANPNWLNNGIPYGWAVTYGLDPLDPNLASEDPDGDGYSNLMEFLNGTNPRVPDAPPDVLVNNGNVYTTSLTIPIRPLSTNYPELLLSVDPSMANALVLPNTGGSTNYTLTDVEGLHYLYFEYADAHGQPSSPLIYKTVTVDRVAPHVEITSPAGTAVLNQAFITLQGIAFDPDPFLTPDARPLKLWINNVPY